MKGRLDPDLVLFCAFSGKNGNIKNQKKSFFSLIISTYLHNHNVYINNQIMH